MVIDIDMDEWADERAELLADIERRQHARAAGLEPTGWTVPRVQDAVVPEREPLAPVITKAAARPAAPRTGLTVDRKLELLCTAVGEAIAELRKEHRDTVLRLEAMNARLLVRIATLEAGDRRTDDAAVLDMREVLNRRRAA